MTLLCPVTGLLQGPGPVLSQQVLAEEPTLPAEHCLCASASTTTDERPVIGHALMGGNPWALKRRLVKSTIKPRFGGLQRVYGQKFPDHLGFLF